MMFTDPVVQKDFFGREETLALLTKRALSHSEGYRQNIAILGPELIGKSSLLQHFILSVKYPRTAVIYLELRRNESFQEFCDHFLAVSLHAYLKSWGMEVTVKDPFPIEPFKTKAPQTASWLEDLLKRRSKYPSVRIFAALLELPSKIWKETGDYTLLVLDEFDRLLNLGMKEPFVALGRQIMVQKETMYLLSSSQIQTAQKILKQRLSLLFGQFEIITLGPFESKTAVNYLREGWQLTSLSDTVSHFLFFLTDGHPFYLNVLGQTLCHTHQEDLRNPAKSVIPALEKVLFNAQGILNQYFTRRVEQILAFDPSGESLAILRVLSQRPLTTQEIRKSFPMPKNLSKKMNRLKEVGVISQNGGFYRFSDRLFAFWLRSCFEKKSDILPGTLSEMSDRFRDETQVLLSHFESQARKTLHERLLGLFDAFQGETIEIGQKRHRLPKFTTLQLCNGKEGEMMIVGNKDKGLWASSFYEREVSEEDILAFVNRCREMKKPIRKMVLAPLAGIHENARLLAKKERMWMWERESLDLLLDLYGQGPLLSQLDRRHG